MSYSNATKWSIIVLLIALFLGWKWVLASYSASNSDAAQQDRAVRNVTEFLTRNHLRVVQSGVYTWQMQLLVAENDFCQIRLAITAARGWHRDIVEKLKRPTSRTFVVFGGHVYPEQPMIRTIADFVRFRLLQDLGFRADGTPVITVIAEPTCQAEQLPWHELR